MVMINDELVITISKKSSDLLLAIEEHLKLDTLIALAHAKANKDTVKVEVETGVLLRLGTATAVLMAALTDKLAKEDNGPKPANTSTSNLN